VNKIMGLRIPQNVGKFLVAKRLVASQEGVCSVESVNIVRKRMGRN
jgi:hypothetical protein